MQSSALQSTVLACMSDVLSSSPDKIRAAEAELKALEVTEEFGLVLASITVSADAPVHYRQLASVVLKQYVETHWSEASDKFAEPVPPDEVKNAIRQLLPNGLRDEERKIRSTVAYAISAIAHWDWPENWPNLFDQLLYALSCDDPNLVHGSMRVLSEFCQEVSDHMPQVAQVVLPQLPRVIAQSQVYSVRTRCRAVNIFSTCANMLFATSEPTHVSHILQPLLPSYLSVFVSVLSSGVEEDGDPGLRKELILALVNLLRCFPRLIKPHLLEVATPIWNILVDGSNLYLRTVVNSLEQPPEACDSDGELVGQESTVFAVFEFVSAVSESRQVCGLLLPSLPTLLYHLIVYMQVTQDQLHSWLEDVEQFVNEDENEFSYSVRLSAYDVIQQLCSESSLRKSCYDAIVVAMEKHIRDSQSNSGHAQSWKVLEACLLAASCLVDAVKSQKSQFDWQAFADTVILPNTATAVSPLLTGRCLWLASKACSFLNRDTVTRFLEATVQCLCSVHNAVLRVLATKASFGFCAELKDTENRELLLPWLPQLLEQLVQLCMEVSEDARLLVLEALSCAIKVDEGVSAGLNSRLIPALMALFYKFSHDPGINLYMEELFKSLANNVYCRSELQSRFLPAAVEVLQASEAHMPLGMVSVTLDVLGLVVRGCGEQWLPQELVTQVFPCLVHRVLQSEDSAVLQSGGECVRAFIASGAQHLIEWVDPQGRSGLYLCVQVILHLLSPLHPEFSATFVGKLIVVFVKKASSLLGEHLELLLRAVLSKMQSVQTSTVVQSLVLVFAHLMQYQLESVISFLVAVPDPSGQPALSYVLNEWCRNHSYFFGAYETKVSSLALCKLLSHCIATRDQRVTNIRVSIDSSSSTSEGVTTRSAKSCRRVEVPVALCLVKLVVGDLQAQLEMDTAEEEGEGGEEEEDEEGEGEGVDSLEALLAPASDYPGYDAGLGWEEGEGEEEDPDLRDDPLMKLDLKAHLVQYLRGLASQAHLQPFLPLLSTLELQVLSSIGIHC